MTRGRITAGTTKKVLVLAVAGALYFSESTIIVPPPTTNPIHYSNVNYDVGGGNINTHYHENEQLSKKRILIEDGEIIKIVELTLKITII